MTRSTSILSADDMRAHGKSFAQQVHAGEIIVLTGPLGAGKTTWVQGFAEGLGVRGPITSPTFVIARIHPSQVSGPNLVHVDAYRVGSTLEFDDLDLDEQLARSVIVIEWGSEVAAALASAWTEVTIERDTADESDGAGGTRTVSIRRALREAPVE